MGYRILVVDDEAIVRKSFARIFAGTDVEVVSSASGNLALDRLQHETFDLVVTDLKMPGMNGLEVLKAIRLLQPEVPVIMITGYATVDTAVEAMKCGAFDYLAKPFTPEQIEEKVREGLARSVAVCSESTEGLLGSYGAIMGRSAPMQAVYRRIRQVAPTDSTVLIYGESGTGKELVARALHENSPRRDRPFVPVDCTALVENLLESELFGHVKGSFTGAIRTKIGLFKVADGGTLFLDEVSNISMTVQAKLLRVLQEREIVPIGGTQSVPINIRLVAATNCDLKELASAGRFREDLYFRLNIIPVHLPPLRERTGDVQLLAHLFLNRYADEVGKQIDGFEPDALHLLESYDFPGNVRELENVVERAVVLCAAERIQREDLELHYHGAPAPDEDYTPKTVEELKELKREARDKAVEPLERAFVLEALRRNEWNITRAAQETGMLRPNFQAMLKKLNISAKSRQG